MKKLLLSLAAVAMASVSNATVYTLYDTEVEEQGWTLNAEDQFELQTSIRGADFTIVTAKDPRASGYRPGIKGAPLRLRENCSLSISSSVEMKKVRFTYAGMSDTYVAQGEVGEGWVQGDITSEVSDDETTTYSMVITNENGSENFSFTSTEKYIMISKIEVTDSDFESGEVGPDAVLESLSDLYEKDIQPGAIVVVNFDMTVAFANNKTTTIYATDNAGDFIKVSGGGEYQNNLIIKGGWTGTFKIENDYFPVIFASTDFPAPDPNEKGEFTPKTVEAAEAVNPMNWADLADNVFTINNVELSAPTPYDQEGLYNDIPFTGTSNDVELTFSNKFNIGSVGAGTYNITVAFSSVEDEAPVFYIVRYEVATPSGIDNISAEAAGEGEYFTLQGIKAKNLNKGIYIRVQNGKASKVMVN